MLDKYMNLQRDIHRIKGMEGEEEKGFILSLKKKLFFFFFQNVALLYQEWFLYVLYMKMYEVTHLRKIGVSEGHQLKKIYF